MNVLLNSWLHNSWSNSLDEKFPVWRKEEMLLQSEAAIYCLMSDRSPWEAHQSVSMKTWHKPLVQLQNIKPKQFAYSYLVSPAERSGWPGLNIRILSLKYWLQLEGRSTSYLYSKEAAGRGRDERNCIQQDKSLPARASPPQSGYSRLTDNTIHN